MKPCSPFRADTQSFTPRSSVKSVIPPLQRGGVGINSHSEGQKVLKISQSPLKDYLSFNPSYLIKARIE